MRAGDGDGWDGHVIGISGHPIGIEGSSGGVKDAFERRFGGIGVIIDRSAVNGAGGVVDFDVDTPF